MLSALAALTWSPLLLGAFLLTGGYFSLRSGFFQIFGVPVWLGRTLLRPKRDKKGALTPFQLLSSALAATIGTGSIAGVATAITFGGPGAVFWMWVSAFLGMMTGCAEKTLSVLLRRRTSDGWLGGPAHWLERAGHPWAGKGFSGATILASLGMGCLVQSNSLAAAVGRLAPLDPHAVGWGCAVLTALVLAGGLGRIGSVCERLVPAMGALYVVGGLWVLLLRWERIPGALAAIFNGGLTPQGLLGGALGWGVRRGVCTNEAGLGSTALLHCTSEGNSPTEEGLWGVLEVFLSTMVVCTVTALVILTSGVDLQGVTGAALSAEAFATGMGRMGYLFLALVLALFAFSTLLGWSWYGGSAVAALLGERWRKVYLAVFLVCIVLGSGARLEAVWQLSDVANGLMGAFSLSALLLHRRKVLQEWQRSGLLFS